MNATYLLISGQLATIPTACNLHITAVIPTVAALQNSLFISLLGRRVLLWACTLKPIGSKDVPLAKSARIENL